MTVNIITGSRSDFSGFYHSDTVVAELRSTPVSVLRSVIGTMNDLFGCQVVILSENLPDDSVRCVTMFGKDDPVDKYTRQHFGIYTDQSTDLFDMLWWRIKNNGTEGVDVLRSRTEIFFTSLMEALKNLRDANIVDLNQETFLKFLEIQNINDLGNKDKYPQVDKFVRSQIQSYMYSLPGYFFTDGTKYNQTTLDLNDLFKSTILNAMDDIKEICGDVFMHPVWSASNTNNKEKALYLWVSPEFHEAHIAPLGDDNSFQKRWFPWTAPHTLSFTHYAFKYCLPIAYAVDKEWVTTFGKDGDELTEFLRRVSFEKVNGPALD